jgi:hypothetical protein
MTAVSDSITCPFIIASEPNTEHSIQQYVYSSVVICVSIVTGTHISLAVTNLLSEALSWKYILPEIVAQH